MASLMHTIFCLEEKWIRNPFVGNSAQKFTYIFKSVYHHAQNHIKKSKI